MDCAKNAANEKSVYRIIVLSFGLSGEEKVYLLFM
jgi:hypothetical protein